MLKIQRRLAAQVLDCAPSNVVFEETKLKEIKEAITKVDIRALVNQGLITKKPPQNQSRSRARVIHTQKVKGKRQGQGSRKGRKTARTDTKDTWITKVRSQRELIREMKENDVISQSTFRDLYLKVKGGFFRNKRHIKLFIGEKQLLKKHEN